MNKFATIRVIDWNQARSIGRNLIRWGFRGQSDTTWPLDSTLRRAMSLYTLPPSCLNHREYWMLRQFERRAQHQLRGVPRPVNKLDWLSLIQHYGGPTRLLDFSHSFYVAAFFAMEKAEHDAVVWAVNLEKVERRIALEMKADTSRENIDHINTRHTEFINSYLGIDKPHPSSTKLIVNVEPEHLHERLTTQQGFFLCPTDITVPFEESLASTLGIEASVLHEPDETDWTDIQASKNSFGALKIILPRGTHRDGIGDLKDMNINAATLFPGLDGFARSMYYHLRAAEGLWRF